MSADGLVLVSQRLVSRLVSLVDSKNFSLTSWPNLDSEISRRYLVLRTGTSDHIPQILWDAITCPCPWCLLLAHRSPCLVTSIHCTICIILFKDYVGQKNCLNLYSFCSSWPNLASEISWRYLALRAGTSDYIPQILWDVITCPCPDTCFWHIAPHVSSLQFIAPFVSSFL